jgi:glutamate racemase
MNTDQDLKLESFFAKEHATVLITDSGLGGLSIFAAIATRLTRDPIFPAANLIYYNAWPEQNRGYNKLKDMTERIRVFDQALEGMMKFQPDIVMIACNTLSAIYEKTTFSRKKTVPVIDIVRFGVDMVTHHLTDKEDAAAVLLGTATTIASDVHRSTLIKEGIPSHRLITQPCDQLATQIEKGPESDRVKQMIGTFMDQAIEKIDSVPSELHVALLCTHFGYSQRLIKKKFETRLQIPVTVLDPNLQMAEFLFNASGGRRHERARVNLRVVSRIVWDQKKIDAVSKLIEKVSPETAQALKDYELIPDLFIY